MTELTRRNALKLGGLGAATVMSGAAAPAIAGIELPPTDADVSVAAKDTRFWTQVASFYDVSRDVINLEHGYWGMMARPVLEAHESYLEDVNRRGSVYARQHYDADFEAARERVARALGIEVGEVALTRNATEALQNLIGGYNRLRPGDTVLYADLDYDSMQTAMGWLKERRGVDVVTIDIPEPATRQGLIDTYERALRKFPKVRLLLLTHLSHRTGLVMPVREICEMARAAGVAVIVDAAHSWGQIDLNIKDLGADFVGLNLHKWIGAPVGVGAMVIRKNRIADIDPYMGQPDPEPHDIRARVHTGTCNFAAFLAVPDALDFHAKVGPKRKEERLRHLRNLWAEHVRDIGKIEVLTPPDPALHAGITSFRLKGMTSAEDNIALAKRLLDQYGIFTVHRTGVAAGACIRVTPAIFTSESDVLALRKALIDLAAS